MNKEFFKENRKNLISKLEDNSVTVLFSGNAPYKSADGQYPFVQNRNFYYVTGFPRENAVFMVFKEDGKVIERLYIERQDPIMAKWVGERLSVDEAKELTGIDEIKYIDEFESDFGRIGVSSIDYETLYLDLERQEFNIRNSEPIEFSKAAISRYPYLRIKNIFSYIAELRMIKREAEVELTKKAIEITKEGIYNMMKHSKECKNECELEAWFDFTLRKNGIKFTAFDTIIGSGKNGTVLHYADNNSEIEEGSLVLLDLGAQYKLYNADISRTFPANGKFTERQKEVYNKVLNAMKKVEEAAKPGVTFEEIEEVAKNELAKGCVELGLIKDEKDVTKYYFHHVTHHLGLDDHDVGSYNIELKEGMMISNEPGLYIPEEKIGIRIEDDLLITKDGCINLAKDIIREVDDIEKLMNEK